MNLAAFYTPDKIEQIFTELEITPTTDPVVARNRIETYLRLQKIKAAEVTDVAKEQETVQQNAQLAFTTRINALDGKKSSSITIEVIDASDFTGFPDNSVLSVHIRAGSGRASSKSVEACRNPSFEKEKFTILVADELLNLEQMWHLLQFTPLSIFTVSRRSDGVAAVHGIGEADLGDFVEKVIQGSDQLQKEVSLHELGSKDTVVGSVVVRVGFSGAGTAESMTKEKNEQLLSQIIAFRASKQRMHEQFTQQCQIFKSEYNCAISSARRPVFMPLMLRRDDGEMCPSCTLISPIYSKELNSVQRAYRFVQLFPSAVAGEPQAENVFCRPFVTLSRGSATEEDKAILLCSLLRGLAVPAFVASGATRDNLYYFCVICIFGDLAQLYYKNEIFCLKRVSEGVYDIYEHTNDHPGLQTIQKLDILTVDCLFNEQDIFVSYTANCTNIEIENKQISGVSFSLSSQALWKRFDRQVVRDLTVNAELPPEIVSFVPVDAELCADILEEKLWQMISARRADVGLETPKYEPLSRMLGQALPCYEMEQMSGVIIGNEQFRLTCKNFVNEGECLIAFPVEVSGPLRFHAPSVFRAILSNEEGKRAVEAVGDGLRMGLRVYVEGYAETVCAVWVIVGACYKSVI